MAISSYRGASGPPSASGRAFAAGHGLLARLQGVVHLLAGQAALLVRDLSHGAAGLERLLRDLGGLLVADERVERRRHRDALLDVAFRALLVGLEVVEALRLEVAARRA